MVCIYRYGEFLHLHALLVASLGYVLTGVVGCGFDADSQWRRRTEDQLSEIRAGTEDDIYNPHPGLLGDLLNDKSIKSNLQAVTFMMTDVSTADYARLKHFPNLTAASMYDIKGADKLVTQLAECPGITKFSIDQTDLSDSGLKTIADMKNLTELGINSYGGQLSTSGLNELAALKELRELRLYLGPSTPDLQELRAALPDCDIKLEDQ